MIRAFERFADFSGPAGHAPMPTAPHRGAGMEIDFNAFQSRFLIFISPGSMSRLTAALFPAVEDRYSYEAPGVHEVIRNGDKVTAAHSLLRRRL